MRLQNHQLRALAAGQPCPAPKAARKNLESECQRALIRWWKVECKRFGIPECLLFSIPNGGGGGAKRGHWLKLEGQRKGAPDLCLAVPKLYDAKAETTDIEFAGLFLELKTPTGVLSLDQQLFHEALKSQGYRVEVVRSLEECQKVITEYLT